MCIYYNMCIYICILYIYIYIYIYIHTYMHVKTESFAAAASNRHMCRSPDLGQTHIMHVLGTLRVRWIGSLFLHVSQGQNSSEGKHIGIAWGSYQRATRLYKWSFDHSSGGSMAWKRLLEWGQTGCRWAPLLRHESVQGVISPRLLGRRLQLWTIKKTEDDKWITFLIWMFL